MWKRRVAVLAVMSFSLGLIATADNAHALLTNQIVPVAVIDTGKAIGDDAFGVTYDPIHDLIWAHASLPSAFAFTPLKNLVLGALPIDGFSGLPSLTFAVGAVPLTDPAGAPIGGIQALGFDPTLGPNGSIMVHDTFPNLLTTVDPVLGVNNGSLAIPPVPLATGWLDGLDVEGPDIYFSPEGGVGFGKSFKNGAVFLDSTVFAQSDISSVSAGTSITRWAGIEAVTGLGHIYTAAEVDGGGGPVGRTIATYDLAGNFVAVDPDGSPFASRIEDLAYDGRYLYGASLGDSRIFVFDLVGAGGTIPEPLTFVSLAGAVMLLSGRYTRRRDA
jgi:hypothetical protein